MKELKTRAVPPDLTQGILIRAKNERVYNFLVGFDRFSETDRYSDVNKILYSSHTETLPDLNITVSDTRGYTFGSLFMIMQSYIETPTKKLADSIIIQLPKLIKDIDMLLVYDGVRGKFSILNTEEILEIWHV